MRINNAHLCAVASGKLPFQGTRTISIRAIDLNSSMGQMACRAGARRSEIEPPGARPGKGEKLAQRREHRHQTTQAIQSGAFQRNSTRSSR